MPNGPHLLVHDRSSRCFRVVRLDTKLTLTNALISPEHLAHFAMEEISVPRKLNEPSLDEAYAKATVSIYNRAMDSARNNKSDFVCVGTIEPIPPWAIYGVLRYVAHVDFYTARHTPILKRASEATLIEPKADRILKKGCF